MHAAAIPQPKSETAAPSVHASQMRSLQRLRAAAIILVAVGLACLIGIASRPAGLLASLWPANAVFLVLLIRIPGASGPLGWLAGFAGYMLADLLTGAELWRALLLNGSNLAGVFAAWLVLRRDPQKIIGLPHPMAVFMLVLASVIAGITAGIFGALSNPLLFGGTRSDGFLYWSFGEVVNYVSLLPMLLSAPGPGSVIARLRSGFQMRRFDVLPALFAGGSFALAMLFPGPGTIAFPVIALLWCALNYTVFPTAVLTYVFSTLGLLGLSKIGLLEGVHGGIEAMELFSVRLGVTSLAVAPILLSIVMHHRKQLMAELSRLARNDPLTGLLNRGAFHEAAGAALAETRHPAALLMIDLDHFKSINDSHGHATGDAALRAVAERLAEGLRPNDLIGRIGGEEFAILLTACDADEALAVAERLRMSLASAPIRTPQGTSLAVTASFGVTLLVDPSSGQLEPALARADRAVYSAKSLGRNRVSIGA